MPRLVHLSHNMQHLLTCPSNSETMCLNEAPCITRFSLSTPMEADILFHFASLNQPSDRLALADFARVLEASWFPGQYCYHWTCCQHPEAVLFDFNSNVVSATPSVATAGA